MSAAAKPHVRATVIGAGAWGTALGVVLAQKGHRVTLWSYEEDVYNPAPFGTMVQRWLETKARLEAATTKG